ncbi:MAG: efflux transporter outer membrane subunit [Proteobacteria bacterium]|nr:efflux transporter outer membrane subunit [Pseudomonadota bacterium]
MIARRSWQPSGTLLALAFMLGGCTVGPDFQRPAPPPVERYDREQITATQATPGLADGQAQHFDVGRDIPADWWRLFRSPQLNDLVAQALRNNPDLQAAQAALRQAHEATLAQRGSAFPAVSVGVNAQRQQDPSGSLAPTPSNNASLYSLITPQVSVSYAPDLFGLNRRTAESLAAQEQASRYQMLAARVSLSTNVVQAAVQGAALRAQIEASRQVIDIDARMVEILRYQLRKGYADRMALAAQEAQLAQGQAALPPLLTQQAQQRHALAALLGVASSQAPVVDFDLDTLKLPTDLPLSLPSTLVRQRPDVLQAQAQLHAANAQVGVAIADRFPSFQIGANVGSSALKTSQLFTAGTGFWNLTGALTAPIFEGGALLHAERGAQAAYDQAAAQYRGTVVSAFQNVADTLSALEHDAQALHAAADADTAARVTLDLTQARYRAGYADYLTLLGAQQSSQQARIALAQARAARLTDTAALFQALGGGWWQDENTAGRTGPHDDPRRPPR